MDEMGAKLLAFLNRFEGKPITWGVDDCTSSAALWLAENGIKVRTEPYSTREEGRAIIKRHGSLVDLWEWALAGTGVRERFGTPEIGDVAVIDTRLMGQVGVICASGGICAWRKAHGGFFWIAPRSFVKVWAIS